MTLALSCEVVHEKLWKSVSICKSYSKKTVAPFFLGHGVDAELQALKSVDTVCTTQLCRMSASWFYSQRVECFSIAYQTVTERNGFGNRTFQWFYRATRMHSADYAVARRLSVRHTPVLCINGYTYPQTFFTIGSPTILVFKRLTLR